MFDKIPISTIKLPGERFQTFYDISLYKELRWKSRRPQNKAFIRGASPGIPYELWDKNTIGWQRWNIAAQERPVCDMEVEIVTFVVMGSAQLAVTLDRQIHKSWLPYISLFRYIVKYPFTKPHVYMFWGHHFLIFKVLSNQNLKCLIHFSRSLCLYHYSI